MKSDEPLEGSHGYDFPITDQRLAEARTAKRPFVIHPIAQRLSFYFLGGAVVLIFILTLASSMNPSDDAMRDSEMALRLGSWDGQWVGTESLMSLSGNRLATFTARREYWSTSIMIQTEHYLRTAEDGTSVEQVWINKIGDDQGIIARRATTKSNQLPPFEGRLNEGSIFLTCQTDYGYTVRRSWISTNVLHTEEFFFPANEGEDPTVIIGTYKRTGESSDPPEFP